MCIKNCHQKDIHLRFYGNEVCYKHWTEHCKNALNLKDELKIKEEK